MKRERIGGGGMRALVMLAVVASALLVGGCARETEASIGEVAPAAVLALVGAPDGPLLLDVRTPEEFASGRIPGAVNLPHTELAGRLGELDRDRGIVVYCERGTRAAIAADLLAEAGFARVQHLDGDMAGWRAAEMSIEK